MINVNLLRPEKKEVAVGERVVTRIEEEKERGISIPAIIGAAAITVVTIGLMYFLQDSQYQDIKKQRDENRITVQQKEPVLKKLEEVKQIRAALDQKVKTIGALDSRRRDAVKMMDKLSSSLPDWVWLTGMSFRNNNVTIDGKAMSNNLISDFITNLNSSTFFGNVQMISSSRKKEGLNDVYIFSLTCTYIRPAEDISKGV